MYFKVLHRTSVVFQQRNTTVTFHTSGDLFSQGFNRKRCVCLSSVLDGGCRCCRWPEWELSGSRHVAAVFGRRVPARLEGAGRTTAGRRLGAFHRDDGCEDLPAPRPGTAAATAATGSQELVRKREGEINPHRFQFDKCIWCHIELV